MTALRYTPIMKLPSDHSGGRQEEIRGALRLPGMQTRQVMRMNAYEITMIVIASMTLLLKVIEVIINLMKK